MKETLRHARGGVRPRLGCLLLEYAATWRGCSHMEKMQPHGEDAATWRGCSHMERNTTFFLLL